MSGKSARMGGRIEAIRDWQTESIDTTLDKRGILNFEHKGIKCKLKTSNIQLVSRLHTLTKFRTSPCVLLMPVMR